MFLLLDPDNTLLPSKQAYDYAIQELSKDWQSKKLGSESDFLTEYAKSRTIIKNQLSHHSSNRLRILCFKNIFDRRKNGIDGGDIELLLWLEERYFFHFGQSLKNCREQNPEWKTLVLILDSLFKKNNALVLTNENLRTQLFKLRSFFPPDLKIPFVTSEEIGVEKPHPNYFKYALNRIDKKPNECIMIGDNIEDDINGANSSGISGIHLKSIFGKDPSVHQIQSNKNDVKNFEAFQIIKAINFGLELKS